MFREKAKNFKKYIQMIKKNHLNSKKLSIIHNFRFRNYFINSNQLTNEENFTNSSCSKYWCF